MAVPGREGNSKPICCLPSRPAASRESQKRIPPIPRNSGRANIRATVRRESLQTRCIPSRVPLAPPQPITHALDEPEQFEGADADNLVDAKATIQPRPWTLRVVPPNATCEVTRPKATTGPKQCRLIRSACHPVRLVWP